MEGWKSVISGQKRCMGNAGGLNIATRTYIGDLTFFYHSRVYALRFSRQHFLFDTAIQAFLRAYCARKSYVVILTLRDQALSMNRDSVYTFCFHIRQCKHRRFPFLPYILLPFTIGRKLGRRVLSRQRWHVRDNLLFVGTGATTTRFRKPLSDGELEALRISISLFNLFDT